MAAIHCWSKNLEYSFIRVLQQEVPEFNLPDSMIEMDPVEQAKAHIVIEIIEYIPNAVVSRIIIKKTTGNITATSISSGEELSERTIAFDTYVQIIDGTAEVTIGKQLFVLKLGEGIIIPAHSRHSFTAAKQCKMITTVIKSGYES